MTDDNHIIPLIRENTEKGFRLLMAKYKEPVYWHIRRLVVSHADAQDATQDTFLRIFGVGQNIVGDRSTVAAEFMFCFFDCFLGACPIEIDNLIVIHA